MPTQIALPSGFQLIKAALNNLKQKWRSTLLVCILYFLSFILGVVPLLGNILFVLATLFFSNALIRLALSKSPSLADIFKKTWCQLLSIVLIAFTVWVVTAGGFIFFVVPGVILVLFFQFAQVMLIDKDALGFEALCQSYRKARPFLWTLFWRWQSFWLYMALLSIVLFVPLGLLIYYLGNNQIAAFALALLSSLVGLLFTWLIIGLSFFYLAHLYLLVSKNEGAVEEAPVWKKVVTVVVYGAILVTIVTAMFSWNLASLESDGWEGKLPKAGDLNQLPGKIENFWPTIASDSDNDGLKDEEEAKVGTDASKPDSDEDGLTDGEEVKEFKSDPLDQDTDNDGILDGEAVLNGLNPAGGSPSSPTGSGGKAPVKKL